MSRSENQDAKVREANVEAFLASTDVAAVLGISAKTLANWRVRGCGPKYAKIGSRVIYSPAELFAFVQSRTRSSTSSSVEASQ
ncbi:MAG: DNA-binding protein [Mesorhizobium sp.]|uniref:helix-turn-helix transcriptional regulator n=1 Tax=Mesorhizobium sp. TaxID=1871066 RepID=UPI000FE71F03|nr:MAG: DNA-binding protein [Mesorhizobium sp.]